MISLCIASSVGIPNRDEELWDECYNEEISEIECNKIDCSNINDPKQRALCFNTLGGLVEQDLDTALELPKRDLGSFLKASGQDDDIDPTDLYEWEPISISISPGERLQYRFQINTSDPSAQEYYEILVFMTANLCGYPSGLVDPNQYLTLYYAFNDTGLYTASQDALDSQYNEQAFDNGYMEGLAYTGAAGNDSYYLNIMLVAEEMRNSNGSFTVQLGVSQDDLVFQWDNETWITLVDSDDTSALFLTGNLTTNYNNATDILESPSNYYTIHIFYDDEANYFTYLNKSWCTVVSQKSLISSDDIVYSFTQRTGGLKEQIYVKGLEPDTNYIAYVTQNFNNINYGGVVFDRLFFSTQKSDTCQLIFNLTFCENVAYSVPQSDDNATNSHFGSLGAVYDSYAENIYKNFSKALQQIACDAEDDQRYSPVVTCDDCALAYKNWLCSVTIPRCTTTNETQYKYRDVGESRNSYINDEVSPPTPYYEILPCIDMCNAIVRNCPSDFGFSCPQDNETISRSYWWEEDYYSYDTCNFVGITYSTSNAMRQVVMSKTVLFMSLIIVGAFVF